MKLSFIAKVITTTILLIHCSFLYSQVNEIYVMTTNAYPRINETQKIVKDNNDSLAFFSSNKSTTISILCSIDYLFKDKFYIRTNYYFQNKYFDRNIENNSSSNFTTSSNTLRNRKIYSTYIDIMKKKDFDFVQIYYGAFIGGFYETPYQEKTTNINYINKLQSSKRIIIYDINGKYAMQIGLIIGAYFKIIKNFKIGMEIRNFLAYQIANQFETTTTTNYGSNNNFIDRTTITNNTNSRILYYNLFNPFFSVKYTIPFHDSKRKQNHLKN
jgi:hypothetical protein